MVQSWNGSSPITREPNSFFCWCCSASLNMQLSSYGPKMAAPAPIITSYISIGRKKERERGEHASLLEGNDRWHISLLFTSPCPAHSFIATLSLAGFSMPSWPIFSSRLHSQGSNDILLPPCQSHSLMIYFLKLKLWRMKGGKSGTSIPALTRDKHKVRPKSVCFSFLGPSISICKMRSLYLFQCISSPRF